SAEDGGFSPNQGLTWSFINLYSVNPKYSLIRSVVDSEKPRHISSAPGPHNHERRDLYVLHYTRFGRPKKKPRTSVDDNFSDIASFNFQEQPESHACDARSYRSHYTGSPPLPSLPV